MLDLTGYSLVFEDEFNGDTLDLTKWDYRSSGARRAGFNAQSQVSVGSGYLTMRCQYLEAGEYGPGWYAGMIRIKQRFLRGYFEINCKCSHPRAFWSAFWIQARSPYNKDISKGGPGGAEIDVLEAYCVREDGAEGLEMNIHVTGKKGSTKEPGQTDHLSIGKFYPENICSGFNTYGCEWTENEYIFYINGEEVGRSCWGDGVSQVDEEVIVSLEIPGSDKTDLLPKDYYDDFVVDYVRVYQKEILMF